MEIKALARHVFHPLLATAFLLTAGSVFAQGVSAGEGRGPDQSRPCSSFPPTQVITSQGPATPVVSEFRADQQLLIPGSTFGHTQVNKSFGHTFSFKKPSECCVYTSGTLTVDIKALSSGPPGSSTSANDGMALMSGGAAVAASQTPWSAPTGVIANALKTITFTVPANVIATGMVSFFVQDDTSVLKAVLTLGGLTNICPSCPTGQAEVTFPGSKDKYCCDGKPGNDKFCCTVQKK